MTTYTAYAWLASPVYQSREGGLGFCSWPGVACWWFLLGRRVFPLPSGSLALRDPSPRVLFLLPFGSGAVQGFIRYLVGFSALFVFRFSSVALQ